LIAEQIVLFRAILDLCMKHILKNMMKTEIYLFIRFMKEDSFVLFFHRLNIVSKSKVRPLRIVKANLKEA
jgi:hypothetical protein